MYCPRCGSQLVQNAPFCAQCGQAIALVQPEPYAPRIRAKGNGLRKVIVAMTLVLGCAAATVWGIKSSGAMAERVQQGVAPLLAKAEKHAGAALAQGGSLSAPVLGDTSSSPSAVLAETVESAGATLQQAASGPSPVTQKPVEAIKMPQEIYDWLKHLEAIESRKQGLSSKQFGSMSAFGGLLKNAGADIAEQVPGARQGEKATEVAEGEFESLKPDWNQLLSDYRSRLAPSECQEIASNYGTGLSEVTEMMGDLESILGGAEQDRSAALSKAMGMRERSKTRIDEPMSRADKGIQAICDKYQTSKWFAIKDPSSGMLSLSP